MTKNFDNGKVFRVKQPTIILLIDPEDGSIVDANDTDIGKNRLDDIFESFNQLDSSSSRKYGGTGLGLTITKKLIELMGGSIKLTSEYGKGSIFSAQFEFVFKKLKDKKSKSIVSENLRLGYYIPKKLNILLAEDDCINQKIFKKILEKKRWTVTIASNGKEALNYLLEDSFDIILMDINMPELDGYEAAKLIAEKKNAHDGQIPIIGISVTAMQEDKERCLEIGMDAYVSKPVKAHNLYSVILKVLNRKAKVNTLIQRFDGDRELISEIINEIICDEYEQGFLNNIEKYIQHSNFKNLSRHIHKFKGGIAYFEASSILNLLEEMQTKCEKKDLCNIEHLYINLKREFAKFKNDLIDSKKIIDSTNSKTRPNN